MSRALTLTKLSGVTITPTGLRASKQLSDEEWLQVGAQIGRIGNALQWASGDWWAYGEDRKYGDGRACAEHVGVNYDTIRNRAVVCRAFELSRRRDNLSFTHHQEVMAAPAEQYDSWLDRAKKEEWSASRLRTEIKQATTAISDQTNRAANEDDQSISNEVDPEKSAAHQKAENAAAYGGETEDQAELESIESEAAVATENNTIDATTPIATAATTKRSTKKSLLEAWEGPSEDHEVIRELAIEEYFERANATDVLERIKKRSDLCKAVRECIETPIKQKLEDARAELNQTRVKLDETRAEVKKLKSNKSVNATAMAERDRNGVHTFRSSRRVAG